MSYPGLCIRRVRRFAPVRTQNQLGRTFTRVPQPNPFVVRIDRLSVGGDWRLPTERPQPPKAKPLEFPVSHPVERVVTDYVDFTGRTNAINSVDIRARVSGYLIKMPFKEGAEVKKGEMLFLVDPRPYEAQYDQAIGQVNLYKAQLAIGQGKLRPRQGGGQNARRSERPATRPRQGGRGRGRRGGQGISGKPEGLQAESQLHQSHFAYRRPG